MATLMVLSIEIQGDLKTEIFLKKDEKVVLWLGPIDYLEERKKRGSGGTGSWSIKIQRDFGIGHRRCMAGVQMNLPTLIKAF